MKLYDFRDSISHLPLGEHSMDVKSSSWKFDDQRELIDRIFAGEEVITISRNDLFQCANNLPEFLIKVLMWGYPRRGRGINIKQLLVPDSFKCILELFESYRGQDVQITQLTYDLKATKYLGISTFTKLLYFMNVKISGYPAVILDRRLINVFQSSKFEEFLPLRIITYDNAIRHYLDYLIITDELARQMDVNPGQIELFLFLLGENLKRE